MEPVIEPNVYQGQKLLFTRDTEVIALVSWLAPMTYGHDIVVPKGTKAVVGHDSVPTAMGFSCVPDDYDEFGNAHIPEHSEKPEKYAGYRLIVLKDFIGNNVKILS